MVLLVLNPNILLTRETPTELKLYPLFIATPSQDTP